MPPRSTWRSAESNHRRVDAALLVDMKFSREAIRIERLMRSTYLVEISCGSPLACAEQNRPPRVKPGEHPEGQGEQSAHYVRALPSSHYSRSDPAASEPRPRIILVHNHPGGDPTPSRADIEMTRIIVEVAKPLGIAVHDHIIVGEQGHASLKGLKLI